MVVRRGAMGMNCGYDIRCGISPDRAPIGRRLYDCDMMCRYHPWARLTYACGPHKITHRGSANAAPRTAGPSWASFASPLFCAALFLIGPYFIILEPDRFHVGRGVGSSGRACALVRTAFLMLFYRGNFIFGCYFPHFDYSCAPSAGGELASRRLGNLSLYPSSSSLLNCCP